MDTNTIVILTVIGLLCLLYWLYTKEKKVTLKRGINKNTNLIDLGIQCQLRNDTNISSNFNNALNSYKLALDNKNTRSKALLHIAKLYHNGIPDRYTKSGQKVNGIPSDPEKAIYYYEKLFELGDPNYNIYKLDMASLYHWGVPGFDGNRSIAKRIYNRLFSEGNYYEKCLAADRLRQMDEEENDGTSIYNNNGSLHQNKWSEYFPNLSMSVQAPHVASVFAGASATNNMIKSRQTNSNSKSYNLPNIKKMVKGRNKGETNINRKTLKENNERNVIRNDLHNVHDHIVNNTIKQAINKLQNSTSLGIDMPTSLVQIRTAIQGTCEDEINNLDKKDPNYAKNRNMIKQRQDDAIAALDHIEKNNHVLSSTNTKEVDLLHLVWNRIHNSVNKENEKTLKQNLVGELSECIENGKTVCTSGRFNRIIDSLNSVDPDVNIKPKWAVQNEMMEKASKIRSNMLENCSSLEKEALESINPTETQQIAQDKFTEKLKNNITNTFHSDYVETGIMSKELLEAELNKWINDI